jgi:hypothetical protein
MYVNLFSALRSVIADALAGEFSSELAAALDARCDHLLRRIELASA